MTDLSYYDIRDSKCDEIDESYLTISQFEDMFSDWYEGDKPENDLIQSDNEVNMLDMGCSESDRSERKRKLTSAIVVSSYTTFLQLFKRSQ